MKYYVANMKSKEDLYAATWKYVQVILLNLKKNFFNLYNESIYFKCLYTS